MARELVLLVHGCADCVALSKIALLLVSWICQHSRNYNNPKSISETLL
jgi:hypothetical protein